MNRRTFFAACAAAVVPLQQPDLIWIDEDLLPMTRLSVSKLSKSQQSIVGHSLSPPKLVSSYTKLASVAPDGNALWQGVGPVAGMYWIENPNGDMTQGNHELAEWFYRWLDNEIT